MADKEGHCALLDYLAVCRGGRGQGTGSAFLEQLKAHYGSFDGLLVEAEAEDTQAGEEDNALRRRRIDFYRRCGFRMLDYRVRHRCRRPGRPPAALPSGRARVQSAPGHGGDSLLVWQRILQLVTQGQT